MPDLLPSDVTGTDIYYSEGGKGEFRFQPGPVFGNILLADEINPAPAKVQAALLEAMEERQVTVGQDTHALPDLFMVMATQNPIEQEGTYPLPEAQTEGAGGVPGAAGRARRAPPGPRRGAGGAGAEACRRDASKTGRGHRPRRRLRRPAIHIAEAVGTYIVNATRSSAKYPAELAKQIDLGASPRAGLALDRCSRAHAWLHGADFVSPGDVQAIAADVLRHRVALSYEARGQGRDPDAVLADLLRLVAPA